MKQSDHFRENAENCQHLAERAADHPTYLRYKRMEEAWRSLAEAQDGVADVHDLRPRWFLDVPGTAVAWFPPG